MKILLKHVGNMGDMVFLVPPVLETLKRLHPDSHITFVTAWGFKERRRHLLPPFNKYDVWGSRNQGGFCISLLATNPHIDQLIHYHDTQLALDGSICWEEGKSYPTWSKAYYEKQKTSREYDLVAELDMGLGHTDNPIHTAYAAVGLPQESYSNYKLYLTPEDNEVAEKVVATWPKPRIILLEGLEGKTTRGWDPGKIPELEKAIQQRYGTAPIWFGGKFIPSYEGRKLTLRENIATLQHADAAIGVLCGPLHFAAAVGLPTLTLYADQIIHRTAPAYFLNQYITDEKRRHRTIIGPTGSTIQFLKHSTPSQNLTPQEATTQGSQTWLQPGRQSTKTPLAVLTVDEIMLVLQDMVG
jgi:ADP-heptose:LPS heptosyltransferase